MARTASPPEGPFRIYLVSSERPGAYPTRIDRRQISIELEGWTRERIEKNAETLAGYNRRYAVLVEPQGSESASIGFRNVAPDQLAAMRRDGFEPAWVVKAGERFDVLLRAPTPITEEESRQLKYHLTARYQLTLPEGVLRDAVRLPGFVAERARPETRAAWVEAGDRTFSAADRVLTQLRNREEHVAIARVARAQPVPEQVADGPITALASELEPSPKLPGLHPVARLLERIVEAADSARPSAALLEMKHPDLLRAAQVANQALIQPLRDRQPMEVERLPAFRELAATEMLLASRRVDREVGLWEAEGWVQWGRKEVAAATRALERGPEPAALDEYARAVASAFAHERAWHAERSDLLQIRAAQTTLAADRLAVAVVLSPRDDRVLEAFRLGVEREAHFRLRTGESLTAATPAGASLPEMKAALEGLRAQDLAIAVVLKTGGAGATGDLASQVGEWRGVLYERLHLEQRVRFVELGQVVTDGRLAERSAPVTEPDFARTLLAWHCRALGEWNVGTPEASTHSTPSTRFAEVLQSVATGDVSPRALGRLQGELVQQLGPERLPLPPSPLPHAEPLELLRRFVRLEQEIRPLAMELSRAPDWIDGGAKRLLEKSAQLVQVHQAVEKLERRLHGVAEPSVAPEGISQGSWDRAWIQRAEEKGLANPERHLGNIGPALAPREVAMERAAVLAKVEVQAVRAVTKELERGVMLR